MPAPTKEYYRKWYLKNREAKIESVKVYQDKNKDQINARKRKVARERRKNNIQYRLKCNLRTRLNTALHKGYKSGSAIKDMGCSIDQLKFWLEFWWDEGMNWNNYGSGKNKWSIDHTIPLAKFDLTDRNQLLQACNYRNLQPMWQLENASKGAT
jgi:hypothetical protein